MTSLASNDEVNARCVIDRDVMNKHTVSNMTDIGLSMFAPLCGKNRGAFVLDPPDGQTYGCISFPSNFAELAGVETDVNIDNSNAIKDEFLAGNITAAATVDLLDFFLENVYHSTSMLDKDPNACDAGGLAMLQCDRQQPPSLLNNGKPIRAVTLAGVFVPAPWATGGKELPLDQAKAFYSEDDFEEMQALGLNTVQIPVPLSAFLADGDNSVEIVLTGLMDLVEGAGLQAILVLVGADNEEAVGAAATYASDSNAIVAMTLPSMEPAILAVARESDAKLPLLLPANQNDLLTLQARDKNVFASLDLTHNIDVADVASSSSVDDRMKQFYHEATACSARSPIEYATCYRDVPVFISTGFDLSIDNCVSEDSALFKDYGQCGRFQETIGSEWWENHRRSFAERQVFTYERGLGWSFATWKLLNGEDDDGWASSVGVIDSPVKLLSLRDVAAAGLMPSLTEISPAPLACLNPPITDFILGDDTLAPTASPLPDCGDGWWNTSIQDCTFWVAPSSTPSGPPLLTSKPLAEAALIGALGALALGAIFLKIFGKRREGYTTLPELYN